MKQKVAIVMGSDSDLPVVQKVVEQLKKLDIPFEARIISAHRTPEKAAKFAAEAANNGFGVIIAVAGMAAHLAGIIAAHTVLPVIGIPCKGGALDGLDALLATVQMPTGVPVATVALNGGANAAILAAQILAIGNPELTTKLQQEKKNMTLEVEKKDQELQNKIYE